MPEPEITEKDGSIQVTIFKVTVGGQIGGQISLLTDRQREVLDLLNPITGYPEASSQNVSESTNLLCKSI